MKATDADFAFCELIDPETGITHRSFSAGLNQDLYPFGDLKECFPFDRLLDAPTGSTKQQEIASGALPDWTGKNDIKPLRYSFSYILPDREGDVLGYVHAVFSGSYQPEAFPYEDFEFLCAGVADHLNLELEKAFSAQVMNSDLSVVEALEHRARLLTETQRFETVGRLAGGVAHDFNNLLAVVLGNADSIDQSKLSDEDIESLNEITSAAVAGSTLTKQFLSFARKSNLSIELIDVVPVVQSMVELAKRIAPARIEFKSRVTEQRPVLAKVDQVLFETALLNLLFNAQEAIEGPGMIVVEVNSYQSDQAQLTCLGTGASDEHFFLISVQDTGCGIAKDDLERIFEPFFTTKDLSEGSGLGLAMVDGFAEQSGGRVRATSIPGKGSTFDLILPFTTSASPEEVEVSNRDSKSIPDCRVLLIEDNPSVLRVLQEILNDECASVTSTVSGDKALEVFLQRPRDFDVIITDVVMPGSLQGLALVRAVRNIRPDIAAVFLSAYPYEAALQGNKLSVQDGFIMKPVRKPALIKAMNEAMQRTKASEGTV